MRSHMQELDQLISYQLKQKEHCFYTLGRRMKHQFDIQSEARTGTDIVDSTILHECINCSMSSQCKMKEEERKLLGEKLKRQGKIEEKELENITNCKRAREWARQINWVYEKELGYYQMEQQLIDTRKQIGAQYLEASQTIASMLSKDGQASEIEGKEFRILQKGLRKYHLKIDHAYRVSNTQIGEQMFLFLKGRKKGKYQVKEIATTLSKLLEERWRPLPRMKQGTLGFQMEAKFHILSGVISKSKNQKQKNGDNFSMYQINSGKYVSMISDGMGTGNLANKDSKNIIETMEELLETGVKEEIAIQCVQMMFSYIPRVERYSTLDYLQINLESGTAIFVKLGACPSFLLRNGQIELISYEGMPIGGLKNHIPMIRKKLEPDDFILQVSDGMIDGYGKDGIPKLVEQIKKVGVNRPQKFVERLMDQLMKDDLFQARDDMTMIGLGIVDKY